MKYTSLSEFEQFINDPLSGKNGQIDKWMDDANIPEEYRDNCRELCNKVIQSIINTMDTSFVVAEFDKSNLDDYIDNQINNLTEELIKCHVTWYPKNIATKLIESGWRKVV